MKSIIRLTLLLPVLFLIFGFEGCQDDPIIVIDQPANGAVLNDQNVDFVIDYENAATDTLEILLNGSDITGSFVIGATQATATLTLADDDYAIVASVENDSGVKVTANSTFSVDSFVPVASSLTIQSGDNQTDFVGATLAAPLVVLVEDQAGDPFAGAVVEFAALTGSVNPASYVTAADGLAQTVLTLPTAPGPVTVAATVQGTTLTVDFSATADTGPAANLIIESGDNQYGVILTPLADPLVVKLTDAYGNPVQGDQVDFASGDGAVNPVSALTDAGGLAATSYTLGGTPGLQQVTATAATTAAATVTFDVNATYVPVAGSITLSVASPVSADIGQVKAYAVVLDQFGNPLEGQTVTIGSTIGSVGTVEDMFDGNYEAWITGLTTVGNGQVTASVDALDDSKSLEVIAGNPTVLNLSVPSTIDASVGEATAQVYVGDAHGNGLAGLTGSITSTIGSVGTISDLGGGNYSALITGLTTPGDTAMVEAIFAGLNDSGDILITGIGTPATLDLSCDTPVSADDGTSNCTVRIEDQFGQGVPGQSVLANSACSNPEIVSDDGNGDYSFEVAGLRTAGGCDVTASLAKAAAALDDTFTIMVEPGEANTADLAVDSPVSADVATSGAMATFTDAWSNNVPGLTVTIDSTGGTVGAVSETAPGVYEATISGLTVAGSYVVNTYWGTVGNSSPLDVVAGAPFAMNLGCSTPVNADVGTSTCTLSVADQYGNPNVNQTITTGNTCGGVESAVSEPGGGNYAFDVNDLRTAMDCEVTAEAGAASDNSLISIIPGATDTVSFSIGSPVSADVGQTTADAFVEDQWGNGKAGLTVNFYADLGTIGATSDLGGGNYSSVISDLRTAGIYNASATAEGKDDSGSFTVTAGAPFAMDVSATSPHLADGVDASSVTATLTDNWSNPIAGQAVVVTSTLGTVASVNDNGNGTYSTSITSLDSGLATVEASVGGVFDQTTVEFMCYAPPPAEGGTNGCPIEGKVEVTVIDDETKLPIAGAFVQVGPAPGDPFGGNSGTADGSGVISFTHVDLTGSQTITAGVPGSTYYSFLTVAEVDANRIVMPLKLQGRVPSATSSINGDVGGFSTSDNDGWLDMGLVMPTLTMADLLTLDLDAMLAPEVPRQAVGPLGITIDVDVPGNIYAPNQWERIDYVLPGIKVTLDFTPYEQLQVETGADHTFYCLAGRVPDQATVDEMTGPDPDLLNVIDLMNFTKVGMSASTYIGGNQTVNFSLTNNMTGSISVTVDNTPVGAGEVYMIAIADLDDLGGRGELAPMGFTAVPSGASYTRSLATVEKTGNFAGSGTVVGSAALLDSGITTQIQRDPGSAATLNTFFNIISGMSQATVTFTFDDPYRSSGTPSPDMDAQLSSIYLKNGDILTYQWDVLAADTGFDLPELPLTGSNYPLTNPVTTPETDLLYWEASGYALTLNGSFNFDEFAFDDINTWITHFTYNKRAINYVE